MIKINCDICKDEIKSKPLELNDNFSDEKINEVCVDCVNYLDKSLLSFDQKQKQERIDFIKHKIHVLKFE